jgi:hypothetical protein
VYEARADEAHPRSPICLSAQLNGWHRINDRADGAQAAPSKGLQLAHFLTESTTPVSQVRLTTDRLSWSGRNRGTNRWARTGRDAPFGVSGQPVSLDTGLNPVLRAILP